MIAATFSTEHRCPLCETIYLQAQECDWCPSSHTVPVMTDSKGNARHRYVRVIHQDSSCILAPAAAAELVAPDPTAYLLEDVFLSLEEFNALPEVGR